MASIMVYMYIYLGLGIILGLVLSLAAVMMGKRKWPLLHITYELRNENKVANVMKARKTTDGNGKTSYWTKPTVLTNGMKALMAKPIIMPPPEYSDITVLKEGGNLLLSFSPTRNIFLPVKFEIDKAGMKMIPKFELLKTWFKTALIDLTKNKLLRPQIKWERIVPIAMMGMFIIMMVVFMIVLQSIPESMSTITSTYKTFTSSIISSTGNIAGSAGSAGSQIANPIG